MRDIRPRRTRGGPLCLPVFVAWAALTSAPAGAAGSQSTEETSPPGRSTRIVVMEPGTDLGVTSLPDPLSSDVQASDQGDQDPNAISFGPAYPRLANLYLH